MKSQKNTTNYWFTIEPYVFVGITDKCVLLYNTLDGVSIESDKKEVIELLREILKKENCGVILLTNENYKQENINTFVSELREKYMGDIIDVSLTKGKPVQLLPFYNYLTNNDIYIKHNFSPLKNVLENLSEISMHVNNVTNLTNLISFLLSLPGNPTFNIIGNLKNVDKYSELLSYLDQQPSPKNIECSYKNIIALQPIFENNFSYKILIDFPLDIEQWHNARHILLTQTLPVEYIFDVSSEEEKKQTEQIIEQFQIENYRINPIYNGNNILFFKKNVYLTKEDILSTSMTIKDFFIRQSMNIYDFGKINIMPNGDVYANLNHPVLGNINKNNIYEIVNKEVKEGKSWFRIRDQAPCNDCVYQWLCPPPSDYEISIGKYNLCDVKN